MMRKILRTEFLVMNLPNSKSVEARKLEQLLGYDMLSTSYKLFWFQSIFKEVIEQNQIISFERIVYRMIASAWYPLVHYNLNFGKMDQLGKLIQYIKNTYNFDHTTKETELLKFLESQKDQKIKKSIIDFCKYVPYRLLTPFYTDDLKGLKDGVKNKIIENKSNLTEDGLYKILSSEKKIIINPKWFEYINHNQSIILGWINYKLIYYLQKKNPNVPAIPFKLHPAEQRDLGKAQKYWKAILNKVDIYDLYIEKKFTKENFKQHGVMSIDHFIPWSFVLHDELWNLIPTFARVNSSKSNKLPNLEKHLEGFCHIQYIGLKTAISGKIELKLLEDYLTIDPNLNLKQMIKDGVILNEEKFKNTIKKSIEPIYQIAYNQGYETINNIGTSSL